MENLILEKRGNFYLAPKLDEQGRNEKSFLSLVIKKIAKATKAAAKRFGAWLDEGARMHNRAMTIIDERYRSNPYHIRMMRGMF